MRLTMQAQFVFLFSLSVNLLFAGACVSGNCNDSYGIYKNDNQENYKGDWKGGRPNGIGEFTDKEGGVYRGQWKMGEMTGLGEYHYANGNSYKGRFSNYKSHGFGTFYFTNGDYYKGTY